MRGRERDRQVVMQILREIEILKGARDEELGNPLIQRGVTQCIINIAENAKRLSDAFRNRTGEAVPWKEIAHTRNIAAHRYEVIDMDIIREILRTSIPELEDVLRKELRAVETQGCVDPEAAHPEGE